MVKQYRLEVAVKRLYGLVGIHESARLLFTVHFSDFPVITIRPQTASGAVQAQRTPGTNEITELIYNVCHKADFHFGDGTHHAFLPTECSCRLVDEQRCNPNATTTWACRCPLLAEAHQTSRTYSSYPMRNAAGDTVGFAEMACRVVELRGGGHAVVQSGTSSMPNNSSHTLFEQDGLTPLGKNSAVRPYILRVILDGETTQRKGTGCVQRAPKQGYGSEDAMSLGSKEVVSHLPSHKSEKVERGPRTASERTLLYALQYDVLYQLQSMCEILSMVLRRERKKLNSLTVSRYAKQLASKVQSSVTHLIKLSNIVLQITHQLVENVAHVNSNGAGDETHGAPGSASSPRKSMTSKLPEPKEGSLAHFLMYDVLFQLQSLDANLSFLVTVHHKEIEVPLDQIPKQHRKFCKELGGEVQVLTKYINIAVQSAVDGRMTKTRTRSLHDKAARASPLSSSSSSRSSSSSSSTQSSSAYTGCTSNTRSSDTNNNSRRSKNSRMSSSAFTGETRIKSASMSSRSVGHMAAVVPQQPAVSPAPVPVSPQPLALSSPAPPPLPSPAAPLLSFAQQPVPATATGSIPLQTNAPAGTFIERPNEVTQAEQLSLLSSPLTGELLASQADAPKPLSISAIAGTAAVGMPSLALPTYPIHNTPSHHGSPWSPSLNSRPPQSVPLSPPPPPAAVTAPTHFASSQPQVSLPQPTTANVIPVPMTPMIPQSPPIMVQAQPVLSTPVPSQSPVAFGTPPALEL